LRTPVTLIAGQFGGPHFGIHPHLETAVRLARTETPAAHYIGAANDASAHLYNDEGDIEAFVRALRDL